MAHQPQSTVTMLDQTLIAPPPEKVAGISIPLTLFDMKWVHVSPVQRLIFYVHVVSKTHFVQTLIPNLKNSLSLTLQHYPPMAGKLTVPSDQSTPPDLRYVPGDGVPLVFAMSDRGDRLDYLTSNGVRSCSEFHPLVPKLPLVKESTGDDSGGLVRVCVFAVQVTLFPEAGICVGISNHHSVADGSGVFDFVRAWSTLSVSLSAALSPENRPFLDRMVIKDPKGLKDLMWSRMKHVKIEHTQGNPLPVVTDKARATLIMTRNDIEKLRSHVIQQRPNTPKPSSFVVTCAYTWTRLLNSKCAASRVTNNNNADVDNDDTVYFICPADCRARLDPPAPTNYFGNCLTTCIARAGARELTGDEGVAIAAEAIGGSIRWQLEGEEGVLRGAEKWSEFFATVEFDRVVSVAGSPRFDYCNKVDFGWGRAKKVEVVSIDYTGAISLGCCRDNNGDIEVGLSVPFDKIDDFITGFYEGLKAL